MGYGVHDTKAVREEITYVVTGVPEEGNQKGREEIFEDTTQENAFEIKQGLSLCDEGALHGTCSSSCWNIPGWSLNFQEKEKPPLGSHARKGRHVEERNPSRSQVFL